MATNAQAPDAPGTDKQRKIFRAVWAQLRDEGWGNLLDDQKFKDAPCLYSRDSFHNFVRAVSRRLVHCRPPIKFRTGSDWVGPEPATFEDFIVQQRKDTVSALIIAINDKSEMAA
jgi:hypothetical protein